MYMRALDRIFRVRQIVGAIRKVFSPKDLFANGEQGVWYDPSDLATLFQDAAGTTPVTAVEQPVGLMLDKSKGGVGTNGAKRVNLLTWTEELTHSDWFKQAGTSISPTKVAAPDGSITAFSVTGNGTSGIYQVATGTVSLGQSVRSIYLRVASGTATVGLKDPANTQRITTCNLTTAWQRFTLTETTPPSGGYVGGLWVFNIPASGIEIVWPDFRTASEVNTLPLYQKITNTWYNALPGNHAYQTTSTKRPVLSSRVNLLTKTEQFDDVVWNKNKSSVTANSVNAPNGTLTADTVTGDGTSGTHFVATLSGSSSVGSNKVLSIYAKAGTNNFIQLRVDYIANAYANFDLASGLKGTTGAGLAFASIEAFSNGWYKCSIATNSSSDNAGIFSIVLVSSAVSGDSESNTLATSVYLWGADLRPTNSGVNLPAYQRVNTATDYDKQGFPSFLRFDGIDDALQTNSIDFTATDKMTVFAGVRKPITNQYDAIVELGGTPDTSNGTFILFGRDTSGPSNYSAISRGTLSSPASTAATIYNAPTTNILTGIGNISGDQSILRVNGVQAAINTANQGTGTYGNYPIYIGARAGTSLFFNGHLYQLVIVGKQVSDLDLIATENFVETKTFGKDMNYVYSDEVQTSLGESITTASGEQIYMQVNYQ